MDFTGRQICGASVRYEDEIVGAVRDLLFDMNDWSVRYVVAETGAWPSPRRVLVEPSCVLAFDLETRSLTLCLSHDQLYQCPPEATRPPVSQQYAVKIAGPPPAALHWADSRLDIDAVEQCPSLESAEAILGHIVVGWDVRNVRVTDVRLHTPADLFRPQIVAVIVRRFWKWSCPEDIPAESVIELGTDHGSVFIEIAHPTVGKA